MRRICALLAVVFAVSGCAGDVAAWEAAKKDLRGDNSQMRSMQQMRSSELPKPTMAP